MRLLIIFAFLIPTTTLFGQEISSDTASKPSNKGRMYAFWGWNRGYYSNSDIHFTGENYDFTLNEVKAKDRPTTFALNPYFHPAWITIPQTNFRIGYFLNDKYDISLGVDHMKYVMVQRQTSKISGDINVGNKYDGSYNNQDIVLDYDFLTFEHTDGLNYINTELTRNDDILKALKIKHNFNKIQLNSLLGLGLGIMMPKSNVMLLYGTRYDEFHLAGYGFAAKAGLNLTIFKYFFLRSEAKYGFINMPSIRTTPSSIDKASQHFSFTQVNFCFGVTLYPFKKSK
ncbi:MAG: hypothetical protein H6587_01420 [Flavobacteriales bacterium]|nr:hypothetical protein [Flavobacteriales bacterium]MCB9363204.1 hypothetical protein [Flavobacteriales bacterium]